MEKRVRKDFSALFLVGIAGILTFGWTAPAGATLATGSADVVIGQTNFTSNQFATSYYTTGSGFRGPMSMAFDCQANPNLWVSDPGNARILRFSPPFSTGMTANLVIGQISTNTSNSVLPLSATLSGYSQSAVAFDNGCRHLWVADDADCRILRFTPPFANGMSADLVVGQPDLNTTSCATATSSATLHSPRALAFDNMGNLWASDTTFTDNGDNRIMRFPAASIATPPGGLIAADAVIAAPASASAMCSPPLSGSCVNYPHGLAFDAAGNLWVADSADNRVLRFPNAANLPSGSVGTPSADIAVGRPNFSSNGQMSRFPVTDNAAGGPAPVTNFGYSASNASLTMPYGVAFDASGNLWALDTAPNRVVRFPASSLTPGNSNIAADALVGQPNASAGGWGTSQTTMMVPEAIALDSSGNLFVADTYNNRVLEFKNDGSALPAPSAPAPVSVATPPSMQGPPVLLFSDLTSGPNTGLGDNVCPAATCGAIVTVWGTNLGSSQGNSQIFVGTVPAAHVYYWKNADGQLPGGPAELYHFQRMQEIAFAIPSAAAIGSSSITVTVNGVASNPLSFIIRPGRIFFVKGGGSNSNRGTWGSPWGTMSYAVDMSNGDANHLAAGDTIYVADNLTDEVWIGRWGNGPYNGAPGNEIAFVSYPGFRSTGQAIAPNTPIGYTGIIGGWSYWVISKFQSMGATNAYAPAAFYRTVGLDILPDPNAICTTSGMTGFIGISYDATQVTMLGNYIHDSGCQTSQSQYHTVYISYNNGVFTYAPYEWGWNHFENNNGSTAFQIYTEHSCGGFQGASSLHDNIIINQRGIGFNIAGWCDSGPVTSGSAVFNIYNNVMINTGMGSFVDQAGAQSFYPVATNFVEAVMTGMAIHFYNNTIYGYGVNNMNPAANPSLGLSVSGLAGTLDFRNNLYYDTFGGPFENPADGTSVGRITGHSNNLWYSPFASAPPSWDTNYKTGNPLFADGPQGYLTLQPGSPALNAGDGADTNWLVKRDFFGALRPNPPSIGAFEALGVASTAPPAAPRGFTLK